MKKTVFHNTIMEKYPEVAEGNFSPEFIAEIKANEIEKATDLLVDCDYNPDSYVMKDIANRWWKAKESIIRLLSKHSNWDWGVCGVCIPNNVNYRSISMDGLWDFYHFLDDYIWPLTEEGDLMIQKTVAIRDFFYQINGKFLNNTFDEIIAKLNELNPDYHLRNNMKTSKAILKICREEGWDKMGPNYTDHDGKEKLEFDRKYAMASDCLNPIEVEYNSFFSVGMVDYWGMSIGENWQSCHNIKYANNPGCYSGGTTSYLLDDCSIVYWDIDKDYEDERPFREGKIRRQMFAYKDRTFLQSRLYPQSMDYGAEDAYKQIRAVFQKIIADCLEEPNLWDAPNRNLDEINEYITSTGINYPDWHHGNPGSQHCLLSKLKSKESYEYMTFGVEPICISCGNVFEDTESIDCCGSGKQTCECCGGRYYEEDMNWCEDVQEWRCQDCSSWDDVAEEYFGGETYWFYRLDWRGRTEEVRVSYDTYENRSCSCDICGNTWLDSDLQNLDGYDVCPECMENETESCEACGELHLREKMFEFENNWYDEDCLEDLAQQLQNDVEEANGRITEIEEILGRSLS